MCRTSDFALACKRWPAVAQASRSRSHLRWITGTAHMPLRTRGQAQPDLTGALPLCGVRVHANADHNAVVNILGRHGASVPARGIGAAARRGALSPDPPADGQGTSTTRAKSGWDQAPNYSFPNHHHCPRNACGISSATLPEHHRRPGLPPAWSDGIALYKVQLRTVHESFQCIPSTAPQGFQGS